MGGNMLGDLNDGFFEVLRALCVTNPELANWLTSAPKGKKQ